MHFQRILITGGAGFVGSNLAVLFRQAFGGVRITALDSLKRRGSELNLARLKRHGIDFIHGDIRCPEDLLSVPAFDLLLDCSAEPSVQAGLKGAPLPVLNSNLVGTLNCLEAVRKNEAALLFISTSRVYPIPLLNAVSFQEHATRFAWDAAPGTPGITAAGVSEDFPVMGGPRSLYGACKLASELIIQEYVYTYRLPALINRCGILAGPWQMGKVDQGVITLWLASHYFEKPLTYCGFGGQGKQVRDLLHVEDFFALLLRQMEDVSLWDGRVYNVGGGAAGSLSLAELTTLSRAVTGKSIPIGSQPETSPVDLRIYMTDHARVTRDLGWSPRRSPAVVAADIHRWLCEHESELRPLFAS